MYIHIFFTIFPAGGHLDFLLILGVVNNADMNPGVCESFQDSSL